MEYRTTYRRTSLAIPVLLGLILAYFGSAALFLYYLPGNEAMNWFLAASGFTLVAVVPIILMTYRLHHWIIEPQGLRISEGPRFPLTGLSRHAEVRFTEIAGVNRIENGLDRYVDIVARDGRRYRLPQAMLSPPKGRIGQPDPDADLDGFVEAIAQAARAAGSPLPASCEVLGFFNTAAGLALQLFLFLLVLAFAGAALWATFEGADLPRHRGGGLVVVLLLPVGAGWLLLRSLRRRRQVLAGRGGQDLARQRA